MCTQLYGEPTSQQASIVSVTRSHALCKERGPQVSWGPELSSSLEHQTPPAPCVGHSGKREDTRVTEAVPRFPASIPQKAVHGVPGVGSCIPCVSLWVGGDGQGDGGQQSWAVFFVVRREGRGLHPLSGRMLVGASPAGRVIAVRGGELMLPAFARSVQNKAMPDGSPARRQFIPFKESVLFRSEET